MIKRNILILVSLVLIFSSCASKKEILYFQDADYYIPQEIFYEPVKIQPNDILKISVGALVQETAAPYNRTMDGSAENSNIELLKLQGYLVGEDGTLNFPVLGTLDVAERTTKELEQGIEELLEKGGHLKEPTVSVRILNAKVTVLGEVARPGTYSFTEQNITLPQALGFAGDLTINGERKDVLLIREENGIRRVHHLDLTSTDWFNTPYFYIKPNDFLVINPNEAKVKSAGLIGNAGIVVTILSLLLTVTVLITR